MLNRGVSFGIIPSVPVWALTILWFALLVYAVKMRELYWGKIGIWLILIGGAGNLVSRVLYGGVVDNWNFFGLLYNNAWDYLIVVGAIIYVIQAVKSKF